MDHVMRQWWPKDGGPIYAETPLDLAHGQWLIEPWNSLSSLLIVAPAIYFLIKLRGHYRENLFLTFCIPLLIAGGMGSTLFHGFRTSSAMLLLDVMPTMLLFIAVSLYFWASVFRNWWAAVGVMVFAFGASWMVYTYFSGGWGINLGYAVRGLIFFIPLVIMLVRTEFRYGWIIAGAVVAFSAALACRLTDKMVIDVLPMGSHFLWHSFTGIGGFLVAEYLLLMKTSKFRLAGDVVPQVV